MRTKEALAVRRAEGMVLGRRKGTYTKFNILKENYTEVIRMLDRGESIAEVCKRYNLSRNTFDRFRKEYPSIQQSFQRRKRIHDPANEADL